MNRLLWTVRISTDTPVICTSQHLNVSVTCIDSSPLLDEKLRNSGLMSGEELIVDILDQKFQLLFKKYFSCLLDLFSNVMLFYCLVLIFKTFEKPACTEFILALNKVPILNKMSQ